MAYVLRDRAKRIKAIGVVKKAWERGFWPFWRNHTTASHEFQLLDVLRDIRLALTFIVLLLLVGLSNEKPTYVIHLDDHVNTAHTFKNRED